MNSLTESPVILALAGLPDYDNLHNERRGKRRLRHRMENEEGMTNVLFTVITLSVGGSPSMFNIRFSFEVRRSMFKKISSNAATTSKMLFA